MTEQRREPRRQITKQVDAAMRSWGPKVTEAACAFESRWTRHALRRYDAKLAAQFQAQLERFREAMDTGTSLEIDAEGSRLCRAYALIAAKMAAGGVADDAYLIGRDPKTKLTIAIGVHPFSARRVRELYGADVQWFSPDDLATMIAINARFKMIADVKQVFIGAEIDEVFDVDQA